MNLMLGDKIHFQRQFYMCFVYVLNVDYTGIDRRQKKMQIMKTWKLRFDKTID